MASHCPLPMVQAAAAIAFQAKHVFLVHKGTTKWDLRKQDHAGLLGCEVSALVSGSTLTSRETDY